MHKNSTLTLGDDFPDEQHREDDPEDTHALGGHLVIVVECLEQVGGGNCGTLGQRCNIYADKLSLLFAGQKHLVGLTSTSESNPAYPYPSNCEPMRVKMAIPAF